MLEKVRGATNRIAKREPVCEVKLADHRKALARLCGHRLIMAECIPSIARVPEGPRHPVGWTLSRAPAWASSEVDPAPAGDARRRPMGEAMAAARVRPTRPLRATAGPRRPAPRRAARIPRVPGFQFARSPPAPRRSPARRSRPPRSPPGRGTETGILATWESANARQDPRFPDSQLADSRSLPATAAAGLRLADAVMALASRPCPNSRC